MSKNNIYYTCENGNDNCIEAFDTFNEAKLYADSNKSVKEIFKYKTDGDDIECLGLEWKRS